MTGSLSFGGLGPGGADDDEAAPPTAGEPSTVGTPAGTPAGTSSSGSSKIFTFLDEGVW